MLALVLIAVLATDVAVAIMFFVMRRYLLTAPIADLTGMDTAAATAEMEEALRSVRRQAEQAATEIARQKAQLRRLLADVEGQQAAQPAVLAQPPLTRPDVVRLAAEGQSLRTIAAHAGVSVEEVRLMLALPESYASA
jgi:DNA-binding NarL/FixJ family response regulator